MQDAKELFYESAQLMIRAEKAHTKAQRDALHAKQIDVLHRVLRVDPSIKEAQYNLGLKYGQGEGVQQDFTQSVAWHRKAADQGLAEAQWALGSMYHDGQGVQQDFKQAVAWYRKAAEQGKAEAQHNLGVMYEQGQGVQQDSKQAAAWYRKAADQGHTRACIGLGQLSENAGDYQAAFESYRAGQAEDRDVVRAGMRRCLEKMAESRKKDQDVVPARN
jgi:TPR repeat protein